MSDKTCNILEEHDFSSLHQNATLMILKIDLKDSPIKYDAVMIEDEVFMFCCDYVKAPGYIQIDTKDSKQKSFIGKKVTFLPKGDSRIVKPIRMYSCIYY